MSDNPTRVGAIGWPIEHSISPAMHNAAFAELELNWKYDLVPAPPGELGDIVSLKLEEENYAGFNVTIPHKSAVLDLPQVDEVSEDVEKIGACNVLVLKPDGYLRAENTDWQGFADDLFANNIKVQGGDCLILGTGGGAKAVDYALKKLGAASITLVSRNDSFRRDIIRYDELAELEGLRLIVNCTPVGMYPDIQESPWPMDVPLPEGAAVYDLVYRPRITLLMQQAQRDGNLNISGLGMLIRQGALAFEMWTGLMPPMNVMSNAARQELGYRG